MRNLAITLSLLLTVAVSFGSPRAGEPAASAEATTPPAVGSELPRIQVTTAEGEPFDVNAAVAEQPTILILYRGGW